MYQLHWTPRCWLALPIILLVSIILYQRPSFAAGQADKFRPYLTVEAAASAKVGADMDQRFFDLAIKTSGGRWTKLSDFRGKIVFLHFWGSWCPPCVQEFPNLHVLYNKFKHDNRIAFIFLQVLEPFEKSAAWLKKNGYKIPIYSSLQKRRRDYKLHLADGSVRNPRSMEVKVYPTTILLDRNGIVTGWHEGPNYYWEYWESGLWDAIKHAPGKLTK